MSAPELAMRAQRFAEVLFAFEEALDWQRLGECYCHDGGADFFDDERRAALRETGLCIADDLAAALAGRTGTSVYFGGSVAELAPWLCEVVVLERHAVLLNQAEEARVLENARAHVARELSLELPPVLEDIQQLPKTLDHIWLVSVLTDPDAFPALHDELYERPGEANADGRSSLATDRARALSILRELMSRATPNALFSTTDEELVLAHEVAADLGRRIEVPDSGRLTAVVGDRLRHCRLA